MDEDEFIKHLTKPSSHDDMLLIEKEKQHRKDLKLIETLDGRKCIFLFRDKTIRKPFNVLTYRGYPDKYFDSERNKVVTSKNSALVRIIMQKRIGRTEIEMVPWKGNRKCKSKTKKCRKCLTAVIAIPKTKKVKLIFNADYVNKHPDEFITYYKCKIFDKKNPNKFIIKYVEVAKANESLPDIRNGYIKLLKKSGVPNLTLMSIFKLSEVQIKRIVRGVKYVEEKSVEMTIDEIVKRKNKTCEA